MTRATIVIREIGRLKPDYSLEFDLPEVSAIGNYISIQRPDKQKPHGKDVIVRKIWWRLKHPETNPFGGETAKVGQLSEIMIECDPALGPYSSDKWRVLTEVTNREGRDRGVRCGPIFSAGWRHGSH